MRSQTPAHQLPRALFLQKPVALGIARHDNPTSQEVTQLLPDELLKLARAWKKDPQGVISSLHDATRA